MACPPLSLPSSKLSTLHRVRKRAQNCCTLCSRQDPQQNNHISSLHGNNPYYSIPTRHPIPIVKEKGRAEHLSFENPEMMLSMMPPSSARKSYRCSSNNAMHIRKLLEILPRYFFQIWATAMTWALLLTTFRATDLLVMRGIMLMILCKVQAYVK